MLLPISFLIENIKSSEEARFFLALRMTSLQKSGYFNLNEVEGFNYRQKLSLVKKLTAKGYINNGHLVSVYRLATHPVTVVVTPDDLSTKKKFKGYIIAATESYIARKQKRRKDKKENARFCVKSKCIVQRQIKIKPVKVKPSNEHKNEATIAISYISQFLGINYSTVQRYRKLSNTNLYKSDILFSKCQLWDWDKCYFLPKSRFFVQRTVKITCRVPVLFNSRFFSDFKPFLLNSTSLSTCNTP